jgi:hypothetical protein
MPPAAVDWPLRLRAFLGRYAEPLLRQVARKLLKPRSTYSTEELTQRILDAAGNAVLIDRRLKELSEPARSLLAVVAMSRQATWRLGGLLELLGFTTATDALAVIFELLESGFIYPERPEQAPPLTTWEEWLGSSAETQYRVWVPPLMASRALAAGPPALEKLTDTVRAPGSWQEADGLELLLRLGLLWQQVRQAPLRLTAQSDFYKRDLERLQEAAFTMPLGEGTATATDFGQALVAIGLAVGILRRQESEIQVGSWPAAWESAALPEVLAEFWALQPQFSAWVPGEGWKGLAAAPSPFASAGVLALAALSQLREGEGVPPEAVGEWIAVHHPYWKDFAHPPDLGEWARQFLLGLACAEKLVQTTTTTEGQRLVRLSPTGQAILGLVTATSSASFPRTLLVQPNLEILAYRQGLTPSLVIQLSRLAQWKTLGAACTLQLEPETVYRGLEAGLSFEQIVQLLQRHSVRELPPNVLQALKTWSDKRERITVYPAAQLLEFKSSEEADAAVQRGLPAVRIAETCLLVPREEDLDFRHFRLLSTRDYSQPPGVCVEVGEDGITLTVDEGRADLLLWSELERYGERQPDVPITGQRRYRLTPAHLQRLSAAPSSVRHLEEWFQQRTGQALPPAVRLLLGTGEGPSLQVRRTLVLEVPSPLVADGLEQWPETRRFLSGRLGPQALAVAEENLPGLQAALAGIRLKMQM